MAEGGYSETHTDENYRYNDSLYTVKLQQDSITITFGSQNIYSTFERIIFKQYPEDLFKPIPNIRGILHTFNYKNEKKVVISLYTSTHKLLTQGKGCREWFDEEFEKLGKQLHIKYYQSKRSQQAIANRQHSSEQMVEQKPASTVSSQQEEQGQHISKQPSTSTVSSLLGANMILSEEEFNNTFAHPYKYVKGPVDWPKRTILLYKYISNAIQQYTDIPEKTWKKVVNKPGKHAELIMIDQLREIQKYLVKQPEKNKDILSIEVILSNSPCSDCSKKLCSLMGALSLNEVEEKDKIQFKITFSNFYKHMEKPYGIDNMEGLKNLLMKDIQLEILTEDNWPYAWDAAGLDTEKQRKDRDSKTERKQREMDDKKIFQYLKELVAVEVTRRDLKSQNLL